MDLGCCRWYSAETSQGVRFRMVGVQGEDVVAELFVANMLNSVELS